MSIASTEALILFFFLALVSVGHKPDKPDEWNLFDSLSPMVLSTVLIGAFIYVDMVFMGGRTLVEVLLWVMRH